MIVVLGQMRGCLLHPGLEEVQAALPADIDTRLEVALWHQRGHFLGQGTLGLTTSTAPFQPRLDAVSMKQMVTR